VIRLHDLTTHGGKVISASGSIVMGNKPAKDIDHEIHREDGSVIDGKTAASGTTGVQKSTGMDSYTIRYKGELHERR
jgi:uncharacterized protein (DUF2345 family)